ncbi:MAG TPA: prepilin-type N-terminal cleavage/methylation domain-containing protein [Isosphaeraceae bacterium]|jgi:type II secretory pathway component PulJ|nr:prepilin-type N-terminal cleavage/methylation domain-containing protein [Isosphaeraceae bacterium]
MRTAARPSPSRGVTLVEMLVTVALMVIIMGIIVQIFSSATGAIHVSQTYQDLDMTLRRLDATIRQDLKGVTARFTPPLDPQKNLGYFEYGENLGADLQGEDTDDYIAMTVKAPEGQPFRGRITLPMLNTNNTLYNTVIVTSDYAEVLYFLRNGNLYRRVLLIKPELKDALALGRRTGGGYFAGSTQTFPQIAVSWLGMNDISARPARASTFGSGAPTPNTLGDLTNRENRIFHQRFENDYRSLTANGIQNNPDGLPDDFLGGSNPNSGYNPDGLPDFYPTLYHPGNSTPTYFAYAMNHGLPGPAASLDTMAFPFIFPGMYSKPSPPLGTIHSLGVNSNGAPVVNHAPLAVGDNLPIPDGSAGSLQTWWGFPTWRETMSVNWVDPVWRLNSNVGSPGQSPGLSYMNFVPLPPVSDQPFNDGAGAAAFFPDLALPGLVWQDDLIATGVRSFDVKAYDAAMRTYVDLGYGVDQGFFAGLNPNGLNGTPPAFPLNGVATPTFQTFAHEGRVPPFTTDGVLDAQWPGLVLRFGDDSTNVPRLRRVWDSWSTDYSIAPSTPIDPFLGPPYAAPAYPSFQAPYPAPLRGIQIQIRLVNDPKSDRIKVLNIRQDLTDKL